MARPSGLAAASFETHRRWRYAKYILDQYEAAIADYDTAFGLKPDLAEAYYFRGAAKRSKGEYKAPIEGYDTTIDLKPDFVFAYLRWEIANYLLDCTWAAEKDWKTALELAEQTGDKSLKAKTNKLPKRVG